MTIAEMRFYETVTRCLPRIADELKRIGDSLEKLTQDKTNEENNDEDQNNW